jgi:hypothetical protein
MVALKISKLPTVRLVDVLFNVTPVTAIEVLLTVTEQSAVFLPSSVVTVMTALPTDTPVTRPLDETVAMVGTLLLHVTLWFVAEAGSTLANKVSVPPTVRLVDVLFRDTCVTA